MSWNTYAQNTQYNRISEEERRQAELFKIQDKLNQHRANCRFPAQPVKLIDYDYFYEKARELKPYFMSFRETENCPSGHTPLIAIGQNETIAEAVNRIECKDDEITVVSKQVIENGLGKYSPYIFDIKLY